MVFGTKVRWIFSSFATKCTNPGTPPLLKAFVNTMALDKKAMAVAQSYGGQVIFAKEVSVIVRFWQYDKQLAVYHRFFFGVKWLVFSVIYVMGQQGGDEVPELGYFIMRFG